ncbi:MAG: AAA family ATPase, partial [Coriobacteriales bacterium]|nr:AAA family ATPase [Coriobacteriales bacterium]
MYRAAIEALYKWKSGDAKKPLIIRGARQVGKTWLMQEFGKSAFGNSVYISFDNNQRMRELFSADLDVTRLITGLELYAGHKIDPQDTLLIF